MFSVICKIFCRYPNGRDLKTQYLQLPIAVCIFSLNLAATFQAVFPLPSAKNSKVRRCTLSVTGQQPLADSKYLTVNSNIRYDGITPRRSLASSKMKSLYLDLGRLLSRTAKRVASRTFRANLSCGILDTWLNQSICDMA